MPILIFLAVLFLLILVHELGHFLVAKWSGMRVDEFGIGFPPKIKGFRRGETEYTLNALPIGGFVRIFGESGTDVPLSPVSDEVRDGRSEQGEAGQGGSPVLTSEGGQWAEQGEAGQGGQIDYSRSFSSKSKWAQAAVLIAGVTMNVLFAWLLFSLALVIGVEKAVDETVAGEGASMTVVEVIPDSPAAEAGIPLRANITSVQAGNETISNELLPSIFGGFVSLHANEEIVINYEYKDVVESVTVSPSSGVIKDDPEKLAVGLSLAMSETVKTPIHVALWESAKITVETLVAITVGITSLLVESVQLKADLSSVAGPIGIVGLVGDAAAFGVVSLIMFTAFISLNLAVINMLPFPALDGGRLLFVAIESVIRRPINPIWMGRVNLIGFGFLLLLMLAVTYSDIVKLI